MPKLVQIIVDEDGESGGPFWHLVITHTSDPAVFCTNEYYGEGQSNAQARTKETSRGGITCPKCMSLIRRIKAVKL